MSPDPSFEIERDRYALMCSGEIAVGECVRVVPVSELARYREAVEELLPWAESHPRSMSKRVAAEARSLLAGEEEK